MRLAALATIVIRPKRWRLSHVTADSKLSALSGLAAALGGCATYGPPSRNIAYFAVPCNTPGAFVAQPLSAPDAPPATPGPGDPAAQPRKMCKLA
jgi:hypothetical protein